MFRGSNGTGCPDSKNPNNQMFYQHNDYIEHPYCLRPQPLGSSGPPACYDGKNAMAFNGSHPTRGPGLKGNYGGPQQHHVTPNYPEQVYAPYADHPPPHGPYPYPYNPGPYSSNMYGPGMQGAPPGSQQFGPPPQPGPTLKQPLPLQQSGPPHYKTGHHAPGGYQYAHAPPPVLARPPTSAHHPSSAHMAPGQAMRSGHASRPPDGVMPSSGPTRPPNSANYELTALAKESKQLKAMLMLHLDLIQEQNEQIADKDKKITAQDELIKELRMKTIMMEEKLQEMQNQVKSLNQLAGQLAPTLSSAEKKTGSVDESGHNSSSEPRSKAPKGNLQKTTAAMPLYESASASAIISTPTVNPKPGAKLVIMSASGDKSLPKPTTTSETNAQASEPKEADPSIVDRDGEEPSSEDAIDRNESAVSNQTLLPDGTGSQASQAMAIRDTSVEDTEDARSATEAKRLESTIAELTISTSKLVESSAFISKTATEVVTASSHRELVEKSTSEVGVQAGITVTSGIAVVSTASIAFSYASPTMIYTTAAPMRSTEEPLAAIPRSLTAAYISVPLHVQGQAIPALRRTIVYLDSSSELLRGEFAIATLPYASMPIPIGAIMPPANVEPAIPAIPTQVAPPVATTEAKTTSLNGSPLGQVNTAKAETNITTATKVSPIPTSKPSEFDPLGPVAIANATQLEVTITDPATEKAPKSLGDKDSQHEPVLMTTTARVVAPVAPSVESGVTMPSTAVGKESMAPSHSDTLAESCVKKPKDVSRKTKKTAKTPSTISLKKKIPGAVVKTVKDTQLKRKRKLSSSTGSFDEAVITHPSDSMPEKILASPETVAGSTSVPATTTPAASPSLATVTTKTKTIEKSSPIKDSSETKSMPPSSSSNGTSVVTADLSIEESDSIDEAMIRTPSESIPEQILANSKNIKRPRKSSHSTLLEMMVESEAKTATQEATRLTSPSAAEVVEGTPSELLSEELASPASDKQETLTISTDVDDDNSKQKLTPLTETTDTDEEVELEVNIDNVSKPDEPEDRTEPDDDPGPCSDIARSAPKIVDKERTKDESKRDDHKVKSGETTRTRKQTEDEEETSEEKSQGLSDVFEDDNEKTTIPTAEQDEDLTQSEASTERQQDEAKAIDDFERELPEDVPHKNENADVDVATETHVDPQKVKVLDSDEVEMDSSKESASEKSPQIVKEVGEEVKASEENEKEPEVISEPEIVSDRAENSETEAVRAKVSEVDELEIVMDAEIVSEPTKEKCEADVHTEEASETEIIGETEETPEADCSRAESNFKMVTEAGTTIEKEKEPEITVDLQEKTTDATERQEESKCDATAIETDSDITSNDVDAIPDAENIDKVETRSEEVATEVVPTEHRMEVEMQTEVASCDTSLEEIISEIADFQEEIAKSPEVVVEDEVRAELEDVDNQQPVDQGMLVESKVSEVPEEESPCESEIKDSGGVVEPAKRLPDDAAGLEVPSAKAEAEAISEAEKIASTVTSHDAAAVVDVAVTEISQPEVADATEKAKGAAQIARSESPDYVTETAGDDLAPLGRDVEPETKKLEEEEEEIAEKQKDDIELPQVQEAHGEFETIVPEAEIEIEMAKDIEAPEIEYEVVIGSESIDQDDDESDGEIFSDDQEISPEYEAHDKGDVVISDTESQTFGQYLGDLVGGFAREETADTKVEDTIRSKEPQKFSRTNFEEFQTSTETHPSAVSSKSDEDVFYAEEVVIEPDDRTVDSLSNLCDDPQLNIESEMATASETKPDEYSMAEDVESQDSVSRQVKRSKKSKPKKHRKDRDHERTDGDEDKFKAKYDLDGKKSSVGEERSAQFLELPIKTSPASKRETLFVVRPKLMEPEGRTIIQAATTSMPASTSNSAVSRESVIMYKELQKNEMLKVKYRLKLERVDTKRLAARCSDTETAESGLEDIEKEPTATARIDNEATSKRRRQISEADSTVADVEGAGSSSHRMDNLTYSVLSRRPSRATEDHHGGGKLSVIRRSSASPANSTHGHLHTPQLYSDISEASVDSNFGAVKIAYSPKPHSALTVAAEEDAVSGVCEASTSSGGTKSDGNTDSTGSYVIAKASIQVEPAKTSKANQKPLKAPSLENYMAMMQVRSAERRGLKAPTITKDFEENDDCSSQEADVEVKATVLQKENKMPQILKIARVKIRRLSPSQMGVGVSAVAAVADNQVADSAGSQSPPRRRKPPTFQPYRVTRFDKSLKKRKSQRDAMTTPLLYCCREWETEEIIQELESFKTGEAALLEVPKWVEWDVMPKKTDLMEAPLLENLSDDSFLKRHNRLEVDEKRRKKWDVQQIREQRRIEKLKARHCKADSRKSSEQETVSFYPASEDVEEILYTDEVPIQAFGMDIPRLSGGNNLFCEFQLPWRAERPPPEDRRPIVVCIEQCDLEPNSTLAAKLEETSVWEVLNSGRKRKQELSDRSRSRSKTSMPNALGANDEVTPTVVAAATLTGTGTGTLRKSKKVKVTRKTRKNKKSENNKRTNETEATVSEIGSRCGIKAIGGGMIFSAPVSPQLPRSDVLPQNADSINLSMIDVPNNLNLITEPRDVSMLQPSPRPARAGIRAVPEPSPSSYNLPLGSFTTPPATQQLLDALMFMSPSSIKSSPPSLVIETSPSDSNTSSIQYKSSPFPQRGASPICTITSAEAEGAIERSRSPMTTESSSYYRPLSFKKPTNDSIDISARPSQLATPLVYYPPPPDESNLSSTHSYESPLSIEVLSDENVNILPRSSGESPLTITQTDATPSSSRDCIWSQSPAPSPAISSSQSPLIDETSARQESAFDRLKNEPPMTQHSSSSSTSTPVDSKGFSSTYTSAAGFAVWSPMPPTEILMSPRASLTSKHPLEESKNSPIAYRSPTLDSPKSLGRQPSVAASTHKYLSSDVLLMSPTHSPPSKGSPLQTEPTDQSLSHSMTTTTYKSPPSDVLLSPARSPPTSDLPFASKSSPSSLAYKSPSGDSVWSPAPPSEAVMSPAQSFPSKPSPSNSNNKSPKAYKSPPADFLWSPAPSPASPFPSKPSPADSCLSFSQSQPSPLAYKSPPGDSLMSPAPSKASPFPYKASPNDSCLSAASQTSSYSDKPSPSDSSGLGIYATNFVPYISTDTTGYETMMSSPDTYKVASNNRELIGATTPYADMMNAVKGLDSLPFAAVSLTSTSVSTSSSTSSSSSSSASSSSSSSATAKQITISNEMPDIIIDTSNQNATGTPLGLSRSGYLPHIIKLKQRQGQILTANSTLPTIGKGKPTSYHLQRIQMARNDVGGQAIGTKTKTSGTLPIDLRAHHPAAAVNAPVDMPSYRTPTATVMMTSGKPRLLHGVDRMLKDSKPP